MFVTVAQIREAFAIQIRIVGYVYIGAVDAKSGPVQRVALDRLLLRCAPDLYRLFILIYEAENKRVRVKFVHLLTGPVLFRVTTEYIILGGFYNCQCFLGLIAFVVEIFGAETMH